MSRFLLDQGIPQSIAVHLRTCGFDAVHVQSLGMSRLSDRLILEHACRERRTVITLDADFHTMLAVGNESGPSVIRIRREGLRGDALAALVAHIWPTIQTRAEEGAMVTVTDKTVRIRRLPLVVDIGP